MSDRGRVTVHGGSLRGAVDALCCADLGELAVAELQQLAAAVTSARSRLAGVEAVVLGALDVRAGGKVASAPGPDGAPGPSVLVQHWWRDTTGLGGPSAGRDVRVSQALRSLPRVLAAVLDGTVGMAQATVLTRLVGQVDAAALAEAEPALIQVAAERDPHALGLHVSHLLATWCEPQFEADERSQEARRYLQTSREPDGMLSGRFRLTRKDSEPFLSLIEPLARPSGLAEGRSVGQRRADALVECCEQVLRFGELGDAGGVRPHVAYVMPAGWAAGQPVCGSFADLVAAGLPTDHGLDIPGAACPGRHDGPGRHACPGRHDGPRRPVEERGAVGAWSGPQTRSHLEQVLCDARLTRVLLDRLGQVKGLEALGASVTNTQRAALRARDRGCAVRGCTRPPSFCDAHHLDHRADGGENTIDNLVLLCRHHHTLWHQGRITLRHLHVPWITGTRDPPF